MGHFGNPTREFGVALLRQALVFGNPTRRVTKNRDSKTGATLCLMETGLV